MRTVGFGLLLIQLIFAHAAEAALIGPDDPWTRDQWERESEKRVEEAFPDAWPRWQKNPSTLGGRAGFSAVVSGKSPAYPYGYGAVPRGRSGVRIYASITGRGWEVQPSFVNLNAPEHGSKDAPDGSALALDTGNWTLFAGWVPQWWGPGWEGSLLLSQAARPRPTVGAILRGTFFGSHGWEARTFLARLEHNRPVPNPLHWGLRLTARVHEKFTLSLSRVAQICGKNRPCGLGQWGKMLMGLDNAGQGGITYSNQPGNQLGGISFRWRSPVGQKDYALYLQGAGEDEAGKLPSRWFWLAGTELWGDSWRGFIEYADTRAKAWYAKPELGTVYNHGVYRMGYRVWNRPLGYILDGDSRMLSAGGLGSIGDYHWLLVVRHWKRERSPVKRWQSQVHLRLKWPFSRSIRLEAQAAIGDSGWASLMISMDQDMVWK